MSSVQYSKLASEGMIKQALFGLGGIALMFLISRIDYQILNSYLSFVLFGGTLALNIFYMAQASLSGGISRGGAFQPSEILKFALVVVLAYMACGFNKTLKSGTKANPYKSRTLRRQMSLEKKMFRKFDTSFKATLFMLIIAAIATVSVLLQSHLSGAIIVFVLAMVTIRVGGGDKRWIIFVWSVAAAAVVVIAINPLIMKNIPGVNGYMVDRVYLWRYKPTASQIRELREAGILGQTADRTQVDASLRAIGSGGWFGLGFGNSIQKYSYLAEAKTDFIFAVVIEELGYIPSLGIIGLFAALIIRCMRVARTTIDKFGAMIVTGVAVQIALEIILNICVITDTMPNTGITFPFFSYGGSALMMLFIEIGFVLSVSRTSRITVDSADALIGETQPTTEEKEE